MKTTLFVCSTCKRSSEDATTEQKPPTCGALFAKQILQAAQNTASNGETLVIVEQPCLMACSQACNIAISKQGCMGYVLGKFEPTKSNALAILEYAHLYHKSETGMVSLKHWPAAIKGHFLACIPPLPPQALQEHAPCNPIKRA
jgi:predicted metal-binding protein